MSNVKVVDLIAEVCSMTGLKEDIVKLVIEGLELSMLNNLLITQLDENDETDYLEIGNLLVDMTNYSDIKINPSTELKSKIHDVIKTGRDYLSESVIMEFNDDLTGRYISTDYQDLFDHEKAIYVGDKDE